MKTRFFCYGALIFVMTLIMISPAKVQAGGMIKGDDHKWISVGLGVRTSFSSVEDAAPDGSSRSKDFDLETMRLYINGSIAKGITFEFNTERVESTGFDGGDKVRVLDALGKFKFSNGFNIWAGRFLPPSDRSNLDGPYFLNVFDFPFVQAYPAIFAGRDNGVAVWGQFNKDKFKYQLGAFEGRNSRTNVGTNPNNKDNLLYTGRLTYNFLDPESGYYNSSTYYGSKDILAIGIVGMYQARGAGSAGAAARGDFTGWNADFLFEKKLATGGVASLEAAYYDYDLDGKADLSLTQGKSYLILSSFLIPQQIGWGKFQPYVRYQNFNRDQSNAAGNRGVHERYEGGVNYIIQGHNARISALYYEDDAGPGAKALGTFKVGLQLQY